MAGDRLSSLKYIGGEFMKQERKVVYVCGPPGTGKTVGVLAICRPWRVEYMNIMNYRRASTWLQGVLDLARETGVCPDYKCSSAAIKLRLIKESFAGPDKLILVVDEVDNFSPADLADFKLYLRELSEAKGLKFIAIANTVNYLLDSSTADLQFEQIICSQYSHKQSTDILESRIEAALRGSALSLTDVCDRDSLRKLGMVMQRSECDVRKMLHIMISSVNIAKQRVDGLATDWLIAEAEGRPTPSFAEAKELLKIHREDVDAAIRRANASPVE